MGIIQIIALIGGIGLVMFFAPYIVALFSSSDEQILQKANGRQEVQAFQERFGPTSPDIDRHGCCTTYVYYTANRTYYYPNPYNQTSNELIPSTRILQLTVLFDGWVTKSSMTCGGDMEPTPLEPDALTIRTTRCLEKNFPKYG
jgi:hypothetical protein